MPVVSGSDIGPLPALVREAGGKTFRAGDSDDLGRQATALWMQPDQLAAMSLEAHAAFLQHYTESANYSVLMRIYDAALREQRDRSSDV